MITVSFQSEIYPWLPYLIFFVCMTVSGALVIFLPETLGRPLPQTIAELESWNDGWCGGIKDEPQVIDEITIQSNQGFQDDNFEKEKQTPNGMSPEYTFNDPSNEKTNPLKSTPSTRM